MSQMSQAKVTCHRAVDQVHLPACHTGHKKGKEGVSQSLFGKGRGEVSQSSLWKGRGYRRAQYKSAHYLRNVLSYATLGLSKRAIVETQSFKKNS
jgi:hypothetical protein